MTMTSEEPVRVRVRPLNSGRGYMRQIQFFGYRVFVTFYGGKLKHPQLQTRAEVKCYYTRIAGLPQSEEGSGQTVPWSLQDAIDRNNERIKKLQQANEILAKALEAWKHADPAIHREAHVRTQPTPRLGGNVDTDVYEVYDELGRDGLDQSNLSGGE